MNYYTLFLIKKWQKNLKCWDYFGVGRRIRKYKSAYTLSVMIAWIQLTVSIYQHLNCEHILTQGVHFQYFISQKYSHMFTKIYIYIYIWMIIWIYNFLKVEENIHQYRKSKEMGKWLRRKETKLWGSYPVTYWVCKTHSGF